MPGSGLWAKSELHKKMKQRPYSSLALFFSSFTLNARGPFDAIVARRVNQRQGKTWLFVKSKAPPQPGPCRINVPIQPYGDSQLFLVCE